MDTHKTCEQTSTLQTAVIIYVLTDSQVALRIERHRPHRERPAGYAVDEESGVRRVLRQAGEVFEGELARVLAHLLRKPYRVVGADLEGDDRTLPVLDAKTTDDEIHI